MGYNYKTKVYTVTWRGKEYDRSCHKAIVKGKEYNIDNWTELNGKIYRAWLHNYEEKDHMLLLNNEDVDKTIEDMIYYIPPEKPKKIEPKYDHPDAISFSEGLILYILAMIFGAIFKDRWMVWIGGSIIFWAWAAKKPKW